MSLIIEILQSYMTKETDFSPVLVTSKNSVLYTANDLNFYQRLIQYFTSVAESNGQYLDLINFNRTLYPEVISLQESEMLFEPEHGYGCPDGSTELADLIREYEKARARRYNHAIGVKVYDYSHFDWMGVGIGAGTTGVVNCLIPAIRDYWRESSDSKSQSIVLTLPQYSVYDGIIAAHGLRPLYLQTNLNHKFLPKAEDFKQALEARPMAAILTFPTNPAQTTFDQQNVAELQTIVNLCQSTETFLIVDNVYQDTIWSSSVINPEVLVLSSINNFVIKVFGPSKDRPGFSGLRLGYYCGDSRLRERFFGSIVCFMLKRTN